jgi:serine/threonine-protein kinase
MITGQQTFGGKTLTDSLAAVIARDPDWRMLPANVHPRVKMLLERCLDKSLDDRYHDVAEARVDIEQVLADPAGVYAHPETPSATAGRWRFLPWAIAAGALAATVTVLITSTLRPGPAVPVTRFVASTYPSMPVTLGNSTVPLVAIAPDGSQIAYPVDQNGLTIYLRDVGQNEGRVLRDGSFMAAPFYSPNGDAIGFVDPFDNTIKRVSRTGSESPQTIYEFETGAFPIGISWTENGNIVFGLSSDGRGLLRMSARGGEVEELTEVVDMEDHAYPEVLPGARHILFTSVGADLMPKVEYLDLDSNTRHVVVSPGSQARYVEPGIIVYNDLGTLRAAAFDAESGRISGDPIPVVDNVEHDENSRGAQFAVSGNGTLVYINRASTGPVMERTLAIVNRNSTRDTLDIRVGPYMHPRVSPDGEEVAVQTLDENDNGIVWIYNLERNALRQLTQRGSNIRPIWTPTGERIAFASNRDGDWGIYWQAADGSDVATRLTTADPGMQHYPDSWSPDGRYLTFTNIDPVNAAIQSIWIMDVDAGSEPTMLVSAASGGVEFSPNGQWIAYRWNQEVFVEPFPQTGALHQVTQDQGSYPVWSPTGEALWYRRAVNATGAPAAPLVAVEVTTDGVFTFGNEQILPMNGFMTFFAYRDYDFMPDGERMVMVFPADLGENEEFVPRANVVLNWAAELGERLGLR